MSADTTVCPPAARKGCPLTANSSPSVAARTQPRRLARRYRRFGGSVLCPTRRGAEPESSRSWGPRGNSVSQCRVR